MKAGGLFGKRDIMLWGASVAAIVGAFVLFDGKGVLTLAASLVGATSLIFSAKGHPVGQLLMVVFSVLYGVISYRCAYYGEMITYLGMTGPMAVFALITWLRNPFAKGSAEVRVDSVGRRESLFAAALTAVVTVCFYYILRAFDTANLMWSTISVATSFLAVYLTFRRSEYYALAYAANDVVLIVLWVAAARHDSACLSVVVCFVIFLLNDLYGFVCWSAMKKRQQAACSA